MTQVQSGRIPGVGDGLTMSEPWDCPTCGAGSHTRYCATCGEKRLEPRDLTLRGLFEHVVESITDVDGRVFHSVRDLVARPGALTAAFLRGQRKPYFAPFQMFLLANIVFFFVQSALGFQTLSNDLASHIGTTRTGNQMYSRIGQSLAERRLATSGRTLEEYSPVFNQAVRVNAKALVILMVPAVALLALGSFPRARYPLITSAVLGLHFVALFLLVNAVMMPLLGIPVGLVLSWLGLYYLWDSLLSLVLLGTLAIWVFKAYRHVYVASRAAAAVKAAILIALFLPVLIAYRFVVFVVTLYTT